MLYSTARLAALTALVASTAASNAFAQRELNLGLGAGLALPTSDFGSDYESGYLGHVRVLFFPGHSPIGLQADLGFGSFAEKAGSAHFKPLTAMGNVVLSGRGRRAIRPYLLAGAGLMAKGRTDNSFSRWAFQAGVGLSIGSSRLFGYVEGRYVTSVEIFTSATYLPIFIGIGFRL